MPSMKRFFNLVSGKKKNQALKFPEIHRNGYHHEDLRYSSYPLSPNHIHNPHQHVPPPPPHSLSHNNHRQPYSSPTQQILHSSQVISTNQCQCQQCIFQQQQQQQHHQQQQLLAHHANSQVQFQSPQAQGIPPTTTQTSHHHHQQQQQVMQQPQYNNMPSQQQQLFQQDRYSQHIVSPQTQAAATTNNHIPCAVAQCTCQHCPYQQQTSQIQLQQQQQQLQYQHHQQQLQMNNGTCTHQTLNQSQYHTDGHIYQQHMTNIPVHQSHATTQLVPNVIHPTTPTTIQQQQQYLHQQTQQQDPPPFQVQAQQSYQCHTIQPQQHQKQKQQYQQQQQQQQHHQRVQSLHHHQQQIMNTFQTQTQQLMVVQPQQQQIRHNDTHIDSEADSQARYANIKACLFEDTLHSQVNSQSKYQEHVYCNQKPVPESKLPPYEAPPDYSTFMERKKPMAHEGSQHMTYHSESLHVGYVNLTNRFSPYGNLGVGRHNPGYTS